MNNIFYCKECHKLLLTWGEYERTIYTRKYIFKNLIGNISSKCYDSSPVSSPGEIIGYYCLSCEKDITKGFNISTQNLLKLIYLVADSRGFFKDKGVSTCLSEDKDELSNEDIDLIIFEHKVETV